MRAWALRPAGIGLVVAFWMGCGAAPSYPPAYDAALRRAEGLERDNHHARAAEQYRAARRSCAGIKRLCARALYREAAERERAGQSGQARHGYLELARRYPRDREAPRALRHAARIDLQAGRLDAARALLWKEIVTYPEVGDAATALAALLETYDREALAILQRLQPRLAATALGDNVLFEIARLLEERGDRASAERVLERLVRRYPYPEGGMWDDALWKLADLAEARADPSAAVRWLERMVSVQESSSIVGSYDLPQFDDAELRIARLWLDALGDLPRAVRVAQRLRDRYAHSLLRDDALVLEAEAHHRSGDDRAACRLRERLRREDPESRFLRPGRWPVSCPR